ncbi:MAG: SMP-30/gluconolactonase/LRE family protein [Nocardioides sp.]|uniref:SMP-30/gluconolactonase/LRE family protein n=1 Tax=Nocardioides sp. TaxID=35761 RepID=UPI0039E23F7A
MITAQLWSEGLARLGEGPRLLPAAGSLEPPGSHQSAALHWVDLLSGTVHTRGHAGDSAVVASYPGETVSALIPLGDGTLAVALRRRLAIADRRGDVLTTLDPRLAPGLRFSDGTAGPSGHLWLGTVPDPDQTAGALGGLLRIGPDGVHTARDGVGFANGVGFSADGSWLFHVDSVARTIERIAHDPTTGELGESRLLFRLPTGPAELDGLAVDEYDRLWVAVFGGGQVLCIPTDGARAGEVVDHVAVPARRVTSCAFAGSTLHITTARVDASVDELSLEPLAGSVFAASCGCAGGPTWEGKPLL